LIHSQYVCPESLNPHDTRLTIWSQVRHVPDRFPGAGFKRPAKVGRELLDVAANGPLDYVKEAFKVGSSTLHTYISVPGLKNAKVNEANFSIAASCFDRMTELADQGLDESVIRSVTATMYLGETICWRYAWGYLFMTLQ